MLDYNTKYNTDFKVIEFTIIEYHDFAVIEVSKAFYEDLFYLGFYLNYKQTDLNNTRRQKFQELWKKKV